MNDLKIISNYSVNSISIQELTTYLDENTDFNDSNSILEAASQFGRLYLNRNLIKDHIISGLKNGLISFESKNRYTPPSIILYDSEEYLLRANLWRSVEEYESSDINLYGLAHDHNFDFLTLNFYGPGYTSKMYTYDYNSISGNINEEVKLKENGVLSLKESEMYFYRKNYDVHSQLPPKSDSITINLMAKFNSYDESKQYIFDTNNNTISKIYGGFYARKHIFEIAKSLNDPECNDILKAIQKTTKCNQSKEYLSNLLLNE